MDAEPEHLPTIEELEQALASDPGNPDSRAELVQALFDRFLYEDGFEGDLKRAGELLKEAPDDLHYERANLAFLKGEDALGMQQLRAAAGQARSESADPISSDELYGWIAPLEGIVPAEAYEVMRDAFSEAWPGSPAVLTLTAVSAPDDASALNSYLEAIQLDENYWLAAIGCGNCYANLKDWATARRYYERALKSESAAESPDLWFSVATCQGKLKLYQEEAASYWKCLELDPDYPFARNNLGWALINAKKNEEAVPVLREAMERGKDGKYPLRNLAVALERLGRYREAIEVLQGDLYKGRLTATAARKIAKLQKVSGS